jgi:ferric-dicitrate binding protein FerR (iron transport regulator)
METPDKNIIIKYLLRECDDLQQKVIENWLNASDENRKEFDAYKATWEKTNQPAEIFLSPDLETELEKYLTQISKQESKQSGGKLRILNFFAGSVRRVAAIILISFGLGSLSGYLFLSPKQNVRLSVLTQHQVISPKGSKSITILPDGTKVWLNAGTTLKYSNNYGIESRDVELTGEAYFKVVTNHQKPFTVITSEFKIKAWGTAFNVKAYPDEKLISTTLEEGKVQIIGKDVNITMKPNQVINFERREFNPATRTVSPKTDNQEQRFEPKIGIQPRIETLNNVNTQLFTSWKDDKWILESRGLSDIAVLLERKFNIKVNLQSGELYKYKFRGTFTNETLEQILNVFRFMAPITYKIEKGVVTIDIDKNRKKNYQEILTP